MQIKLKDWMFTYRIFDPFYQYSTVEFCELVREQYKNYINDYLVGKTIRFNIGFTPPNNVGTVERIEFTNLTPLVHFDNMEFPMFIEFLDIFKYEII